VYWDDTNKLVTTTAGSNIAIGVAIKAAAAGVTVGRVRLNAAFV
jgi:predicted RecA/RadA family phage recombinase